MGRTTFTRTAFIYASLMALIAVLLGAFGAHSLKGHLDAGQIGAYEIGVRYQFYHAMGLFVVGFLASLQAPSKSLRAAMWCFVLGIVLFSGSLYLLSMRDILGIASWTWLGPLTPLGGLFFAAGWTAVLGSQIKAKL